MLGFVEQCVCGRIGSPRLQLTESGLNHIRDLLAQNLRTFLIEVHIPSFLQGIQFRQHQLIQIIDLNVIGPSDAQGGRIISRGILREAKGFHPGREWRRGGKDELGTGGLQLLDENLQVGGIGFQIGLPRVVGIIGILPGFCFHTFQVVQTPVEMDDIPLRVAQPFLQFCESQLGSLRIARIMDHIGLARQLGTHHPGIADGNRIPDDQHIREIGIHFRRPLFTRISRQFCGPLFRNVGLSQPIHDPHHDDRNQSRCTTPSHIDLFDIHFS